MAELIRQLGDKDYKVRDEATQKLIDMDDGVVPFLTAKAREQGLDPEVAARVKTVLEKMRVKASQPVQVNGVEFQVVAQRVWTLNDGTSIPLALKITNRTDKALQFNLFDTVSVIFKDASGKQLKIDGGRDRSAMPAPLLVEKGQSGTIDRTAKLERKDKGYRLTGPDGAGGIWWFDDLKAGTYSVSIGYENTQALAGWVGKVVTKELAVEIVEKAATTQPAAKPVE